MRIDGLGCACVVGLLALAGSAVHAQEPGADWRNDRPGRHHAIDVAALPGPFATGSAANAPDGVAPPAGALPKVPSGFAVTRFATGLAGARTLRVAPNGDVFLAETNGGRILVLRAKPGAPGAERVATYADGLDEPFGIAFYPPGPDPRWVYVAETNRVLRFPYRSGDMAASAKAQVVVAQIAPSEGGHTTRDIRFGPDGKRLFVSVGSASNVAEAMPRLSGDALRRWAASHPLGAAWGAETDRADVLSFDPEGGDRQVFATGLRNCVGLAVQPRTRDLWCATNERDGLGDDLVPDYATRVRPGGWYGWPWVYYGSHDDPRQKGARPDLVGKATLPDVAIQSHSAPLGITFYDPPPGAAATFPAGYDGDAFVTLHGSWNRATPSGYKVVRIHLEDGVPTGGYDDFMTGFVEADGDAVWGRPVGVAVAADGALLVSEDTNGTIYRVAPGARRAAR